MSIKVSNKPQGVPTLAPFLVTTSDAFAWEESDERWLFCCEVLDLCEAEQGADYCEAMVAQLEEAYVAHILLVTGRESFD
jgi:hypothetical protein